MAEEVYVAVGGASESTLTLQWAIRRFSRCKFCILHVRRPSDDIQPCSEEQLEMEEAIRSSIFDKYMRICHESGVQAEKVCLENNSIEEGILEQISRHKIQNLIMGAAADQTYDMEMTEPKSRKAIYVKSHAPSFCNIWFICQGDLVCKREAKVDGSRSSNTNSEAVNLADLLQKLYIEEVEKRKGVEAELQMVKKHHSQTMELVIASYEQTIKQLEEKAATNAQLVKIREEERDEAAKLTMELVDSTDIRLPESFMTLLSSEIWQAVFGADRFTSSLYDEPEGELGSIYKAVLDHTQVTIRVCSALPTFQNELKILSKFRHPNLATLIGASPETPALVYEDLPNGTLEDRLRCKGDTPPLSWQTRIKIMVELCSALMFLHSHGVIHCALRPSCVLLDSNFSCKIIDFRPSVHIGQYTDPEFVDAAAILEPYPSMDVYSFGLMVQELLTGKPGYLVVEQVRSALAETPESTLDSLLDTSAGNWSFLLAKQLAHLGLSCCSAQVSGRPCLEDNVWKVLEPMRLSSGSALPYRLCEAPSYFVCPILQDVMEDPYVAADGYTYEAEGIRGWIDGGKQTSPMTNLPLEDTKLVPNRGLRSAIQEWKQSQRQ